MVQPFGQETVCTHVEDEGLKPPKSAAGHRSRPRRTTRARGSSRPLTADRQALAADNIGLVKVHLRRRLRLRRRSPNTPRDPDDLFQAGCLGLLEAAGRYRPERDGSFATYALPRIRRAIHKCLLSEGFLLRLPYGMACTRRGAAIRGGAPGRRFWPTHDLLDPDHRNTADKETIRHALRRCFEQATRQARDELSHDYWRRPDTAIIFDRIIAERVLVSSTRDRTPVRRLAAELGLYSGQVSEYERRILVAVREQLRNDNAAQLLIAFAQRDPLGFDGPLTAYRQRRLDQAEMRQFNRQFAASDTAQRAKLLYSLVERSPGRADEIARNLFLLTRTGA